MSSGNELHWHWELGTVLPLAVFGAAYLAGVSRLWRRAGLGRGIGFAAFTAFLCGMGLLVLALASPLASLSEELFTAHMVVHEVLMAGAAPLLVLARPRAALAWVLPRALSRSLRPPARIAEPLAATLIQAAVIWAWHVPAFFHAVENSEALHIFQHLSFLASAILFWHAMDQLSARRAGGALGCLFATSMHTGFLGALLLLSPRLWFPAAGGFGLSPLEDQQLGGAIMWVPGGLIYAVAALVAAHKWIGGRSPSTHPGTRRLLRTPVDDFVK